jgi:hypothetical protein
MDNDTDKVRGGECHNVDEDDIGLPQPRCHDFVGTPSVRAPLKIHIH